MTLIEAERQRIQTDRDDFLSWVEAERQAIHNSPNVASSTISWLWLAIGLSIGLAGGVAITTMFF